MNSRERVLAAVNFEQSDRVPVDLGGSPASGINAAIYDKLKRRMGFSTPTKVMYSLALLAEVEIEVLDRLHADVVPLDVSMAAWGGQKATEGIERRLFEGTSVYFQPGTRITVDKDGDWILWGEDGTAVARMPKDGFYFDLIQATMGSRIDANKHNPSTTVPEEELRAIEQRARWIYENTDKAILGWSGGISFLGLSAVVAENITQGALDDWLSMLMIEKETAHEMMDRSVDAAIARMKLYHEAVGERCFAWAVGADDGGTQRAGLIRPSLFEEMIKPHYTRLCDWMHSQTNWKIFLHSCGSIYEYIPHWIEAGIDILNPVQISAANMEPERLKKEFGNSLVFWGGGCDTQKVLPLGTPEEVRAHVRRNLEIFSPGRGYVFAQVHNIQQDVPVANVEAMFQAAYQFGSSPDLHA